MEQVQRQEFMLLFRYTPQPNNPPNSEEMEQIHQAWGAFIGNIAIQEKLVSTHQLGMEGVQIAADHSIREGIHSAEQQTLGGNMIVRANSMNEAVEMAKACPILFMGGTVEVRDIQPM